MACRDKIQYSQGRNPWNEFLTRPIVLAPKIHDTSFDEAACCCYGDIHCKRSKITTSVFSAFARVYLPERCIYLSQLSMFVMLFGAKIYKWVIADGNTIIKRRTGTSIHRSTEAYSTITYTHPPTPLPFLVTLVKQRIICDETIAISLLHLNCNSAMYVL